MNLERAADGTVTITDAQPVESFSRELIGLLSADALSGVTVVNGVITFAVSNGTWVYQIDPLSDNRLMVNATKVSGP